MLESVIEKHLTCKIKAIGGVCYKLSPEYCAGIPDRMVIYNKKIYLIELKQPKGRLSHIQVARHQEICSKGVKVYVLKSISDVDGFIEDITVKGNESGICSRCEKK